MENCDDPRLLKSLALHRALNNVKFVRAAAGGDFSLAVTEHGSVWALGSNAEVGCDVWPFVVLVDLLC